MTRRTIGLILILALGLCGPSVYAQALRPPVRWDLTVDGHFGMPRGYVKVGEHDIAGTRLCLHDDLGMNLSKTVALQVGYHLTTQDTLRFSFLRLFLEGTTTLPEDVLFIGSTLLGGTRLDSAPEFYRATLVSEEGVSSLPADGASLEPDDLDDTDEDASTFTVLTAGVLRRPPAPARSDSLDVTSARRWPSHYLARPQLLTRM
jgi:hypothetical protein